MTEKVEKVAFKGGSVMFMSGIPARDLTPEEWESLDKETRERAVAIGLYEVIGVSPKKPAKQEE